jgi:hypothetical protein
MVELDPYHELGVRRDAEPEAIEGAYRHLARKHHPDHQGADTKGAAEARMKRLTQAVAILRDPAQRANYDRRHPESQAQPSAPGPRPRAGEAPKAEPHPQPRAAPAEEWQNDGKAAAQRRRHEATEERTEAARAQERQQALREFGSALVQILSAAFLCGIAAIVLGLAWLILWMILEPAFAGCGGFEGCSDNNWVRDHVVHLGWIVPIAIGAIFAVAQLVRAFQALWRFVALRYK